tara:strand:- start:1017 stop:1178 length:162 start_codon:yes stop_codon:yes gene_type:complete
MSNSAQSLQKKIREIGFNLAMIEKRGLQGKDHLARRIAHNLLLNQLYELEKKV